MTKDFKFDKEVERNFSEATVKALKVFPQMLASLEALLRNYHKDNSAGLVERPPLPLENLNASGRQIATMFLTKTIYYSRAIIDNVNSGNLLVAFQSRSSSKAVSEINPSTAALIASRSPRASSGK